MALGTLAGIALAVSAASGVAQATTARKSRKDQERRLKEQEERAKAAAALQTTRENTGAEVLVGSEDRDQDVVEGKTRVPRTRKSKLSVGGLPTSKRVGL